MHGFTVGNGLRHTACKDEREVTCELIEAWRVSGVLHAALENHCSCKRDVWAVDDSAPMHAQGSGNETGRDR